jgi:DNA-binding PadR family transcriptional regulator
MKRNKKLQLNTEEIIKQRIFIIRGKKVMIDKDLAEIYGVPTMRLNEQVKRNIKRFPNDFMFQLSDDEFESLISQIAISKQGRGGRRKIPYAFTEQGVAMLSSVLKSELAVQMNIFIMRAFIKMRESLEQYKDLALKIGELEINQIQDHATLKNVHSIVKHLVEKPTEPKKKIGFGR